MGSTTNRPLAMVSLILVLVTLAILCPVPYAKSSCVSVYNTIPTSKQNTGNRQSSDVSLIRTVNGATDFIPVAWSGYNFAVL